MARDPSWACATFGGSRHGSARRPSPSRC